jgi:hypothetical protein
MREEGFQNFPPEWYMEVQSHRKALHPHSQQMIKELFDGAETVHVKVSIFFLHCDKTETERYVRFSIKMGTCWTLMDISGCFTKLQLPLVPQVRSQGLLDTNNRQF